MYIECYCFKYGNVFMYRTDLQTPNIYVYSSCVGSETSSYNSETNDEEEIALAIQAAEKASRNEARARFRSSSDLIHRLFVCIAGKTSVGLGFFPRTVVSK